MGETAPRVTGASHPLGSRKAAHSLHAYGPHRRHSSQNLSFGREGVRNRGASNFMQMSTAVFITKKYYKERTSLLRYN